MSGYREQSAQLQQDDEHLDQREINLVLFSNDGRLWVKRDQNFTQALPRVWIPKWSRMAQEVAQSTAIALNIPLFCLWEIQDLAVSYVVARIDELAAVDVGLSSVMREEFVTGFEDKEIGDLIASAHREAFADSKECDPEPFKRIGWDTRLLRLLEPSVKDLGVELTGKIEQINACPTFSLLKLETTREPIWFKAVGAPNLAEYSFTIGINDLIPNILPPIIATFPEWHAWVSKDSGGNRLSGSTDLKAWRRAMNHLAEIQISSLPHVDDLLRLGCIDRRTATLIDHLELFIEAVRAAMADDLDLDVVRLDGQTTRRLADGIRRALQRIETLEIPDALVHNDLSGGNIQVSQDRSYFIDWAQACISHPFVCSEYIQVHFARALGGSSEYETEARELEQTYVSHWLGVLTPNQVADALLYSPLVAAYLYALPNIGCTCRDYLDTPTKRRFLRSMARRMWRESCRTEYRQHF